jgi:hypothetical protein
MFDFPNSPTVGQQVIEPNGAVVQWDGVKWANVANPNVASPELNNVGRNFVHNSLFTINQRAPGSITSGGYAVDRWVASFIGDTANFLQSAMQDGARATIGDETGTFILQNQGFVGDSGAGSYTRVIHRIESVRRLSGKTVTVSFWALGTGGATKLGVTLGQNFGTGGSPSAPVNPNGQSVNLTGVWQYYTLTFTLPSSAGMTFGTANNDYTIFSFWYSSGATNAAFSGNVGVQSGTINLWGVQLEIGNTPTPLEKRDPMLELALCQRMFFAFNAVAIGYSVGGNNVYGMYTLPVTLRAAPTVVISGQSYFNGSAFALYQSGNRSIAVQTTVTATGVASGGALVSLSADL